MKKLMKERVLSIEHNILRAQDLSATFGLPDASNAWLEAYPEHAVKPMPLDMGI